MTGRTNYEIRTEGDELVFRTPDFTAGRGSVLHEGIYNREFASALAAFALAGMAYAATALNFRRGAPAYAVSLLVFAAGFFVLRALVFREKYLEAVFRGSTGQVEFFFAGTLRRKAETLPPGSVSKLLIETERSGVVNPDGAEFVSKISAQHGMAMPGFDEEKTFFVLKLKLTDGGERVLFVQEDMPAVLGAYERIAQFLGEGYRPEEEAKYKEERG